MRYSNSSNKKLLLFDFGCILVGLSKQRCIDALNKIGCGRIAYYVDECRQEDLFHDLEVGGSIEAFCNEARRQSSYTDEMGKKVACEATDEEICWAWNELLTGVPVEKLRMIRQLKESGYHIAVLSNTNQIHWEKSVKDFFTIDGLTVEDYFDEVFLSCDLAMVKPDAGIYEEVLRRLGVDINDKEAVSRILFIDDSEKNTNAASKIGISTLHDPKGTEWMELLKEKPMAAVIGNFDGVHLGHKYMVSMLKDEAGKRGMSTLAITFDRHPKTFFDKSVKGTYLTTPQEKAELLMEAGIDQVEVLTFDEELANTTARDFMQKMHDEMGVKLLLLGYDNRFGKRNPDEGIEQYVQYGKEIGMEVVQAERMQMEGMDVPSSSAVRKRVIAGDMEGAGSILDRPYSVSGTVVKGFQEGRKIGFPTANILPADDKLLPANGVYMTSVMLDDGRVLHKAVTNIGTRPTYNGSGISVETHIPGFCDDLYGKNIVVSFIRKIRDEQSFSSPEMLKKQIEKDLMECKA